MNVCSFTVHLGADCRVNTVNGTKVCNFPGAAKAGFGDREQTLWLDCALWGKQAESRLPEFLKKGQQVAVSGELSTREHEGKTYLQLRCNSVNLIGKPQEGGGQSAPQQQNNQQQQSKAPQQPQSSAPDPGNFDDFDDEIPF